MILLTLMKLSEIKQVNQALKVAVSLDRLNVDLYIFDQMYSTFKV